MRILFLHQNFPAQYLHLARSLRNRGDDCRAITDARNGRTSTTPTLFYDMDAVADVGRRPGLSEHFDLCTRRGVAVLEAMSRLKRDGFVPDVILAHPGWGEALFARDVFPGARLILQAEHFYDPASADVGFDPEFARRDPLHRLSLRTRNAAMLVSFAAADLLVAPTRWQASRFPDVLQSRLRVVHEGIDTRLAAPDPSASVSLGRDDVVLKVGDEVVTFVNRNLEPYRGFHVFMRALPDILRARPNARAVIVGGEDVSYGPRSPTGRSWKSIYLDETRDRLPMDRVHFVRRISHHLLVRLMQVSAVHVYLTYPFVLSWSMLEAMSAGAFVIGSRTAPVEEVITDGENGRLVDFFDRDGLAAAAIEALTHPDRLRAVRAAARRTVLERYDLETRCLPAWLRLVDGHG